jgi:hypothetical protein
MDRQMMKLFPDIMLSAEGSEDLSFDLSPGTVALGKSGRYEDYAVIPSAPWRMPTQEEVSILTSRGLPPNRNAVSLIKLPPTLLEPFKPSPNLLGKGQLELSSLLNGQTYDSARRSITNYVNTQLRAASDLAAAQDLVGGVFVRPPAQCTTTTDYASGRFVGLHVDNWSDYPIDERVDAPNRIAIGSEDRHFLYVNASLTAMFEKVRSLVNHNHHGTVIGRVFMTLFPFYPVVRVCVRPGWAYIAPTENLVHDATTTDMKTWDVTLSLRGYISPRLANES